MIASKPLQPLSFCWKQIFFQAVRNDASRKEGKKKNTRQDIYFLFYSFRCLENNVSVLIFFIFVSFE